MIAAKSTLMHPISEILCRVYNGLVEQGEVVFPLHKVQQDNLNAVVHAVEASFAGFRRYPSLNTRAAAYFVFIIKDHPVTDGNKRLALLWLQLFCDALGLKLVPATSLDALAVSVEKASVVKMDELVSLVEAALFDGMAKSQPPA